jgi:vanillate monooxygenase
MILKNFWFVGATASELGHDPIGRMICKLPMVFFRQSSGSAAAVRNYCSHRRAPLSRGRVVGEAIECPYHGMQFDASGKCVSIPCQDKIRARAHIPSYSVIERYGLIWVWVGDDPADSAKLPALPWREDPAWDPDIIYHYHVNASHMLMTNNLLDLGHVAFIHADTIGFDPAALKNDPLKTEVDGDRVRNTRIIPNAEPSPNAISWGGFKGKIERASISTWYPPHYTHINFWSRDERTSVDLHIDHFMTPETDRTHNYWVAVTRNFGVGDPAVGKRVFHDNDKVHQQDLAIVEAQQRMINLAPDHLDMPIAQDRGLVIAHRIMERIYMEQNARVSQQVEELRESSVTQIA